MLLVERLENRLGAAAWGVTLDDYDAVRDSFDATLTAQVEKVKPEQRDLMNALRLTDGS